MATLTDSSPRFVVDALRGASPDELHRLYVRNAESFYRV